ncbi:MAG: indolepyruvate ferredoxin oxidoreductase family protein [Paracoccaceae bacterium]
MGRQDVSLHDKFDLNKSPVLMNGTQALVRLMLMQKARDVAAGLNTAGYVTGYRGSPVGAVDAQMTRAQADLEAADVLFHPGLNEDLAATALWGTQQAELRGEGKFDGVFGLWYGKGPGVDRSGDVMRHANMAGTSPHGGVLMALGDDHTGESSTTLHQSDWAVMDAYMPVLSPAGVQEILDYGVYGLALSRFAGVWVGLKLMKDTVEVTSVVYGDPERMQIKVPRFDMPEGGLNIRLTDTPVAQEARIIDHKRFAAEAFAKANKINHRVWGERGAKIGFVAAGKNWLDLEHALTLLGIDSAEAKRLGITTYKVGQVWPLDMDGFHDWAEGLDLIVVVEEKRKLIEVQVKEAIFDDRRGRRVYGWMKNGQELFPTRFALSPIQIAKSLAGILAEEGCDTDKVKSGLQDIEDAEKSDNAPDLAARLPYFCSGCPHNTSTKIPKGSRAYAGIGCHYMVQWMDRDTVGFTQMGGEGANWIGEAPFSKREHVFQNLGDGTYNHSGIQAIRAAVAAGTTMTYKILFNDAVAMTGGQPNDGGLDAARIAHEVRAIGVTELVLVYDEKEDIEFGDFPAGMARYRRQELLAVEEKIRDTKGVSVILYVQTCAAEKRRRRKRGLFPDPDKRVFINTDVCEGCGDCGVQSNCVSIVPVDTALGRKRAIDQSSCNKDFSCVDGFCPSFVTIEGAQIRKAATAEIELGELPEPELPKINGTHNVIITGVGGTGVVTIGAGLAMAAHIDGRGVAMMEMAGLAQKGGSVHIHLRIAEKPGDISAVRVATGECDTVIGGDLVTTAGAKTIALMKTGKTGAVVNSHDTITGDFTRDADFSVPNERLKLALQARLEGGVVMFDAALLAQKLLGDTIFASNILNGAAWQQGLLPVTRSAILQAIVLNGAAPERNKRAFEIGRWAVLNQEKLAEILSGDAPDLEQGMEQQIDTLAQHLVNFQSVRLARKYRRFLGHIKDDALRAAVAKGYHKVLAYKDEYEVARLLLSTRTKAQATFEGDLKLTYHMAPPVLSWINSSGAPMKREFGRWMGRVFPVLAWFKFLRGTPFDPFGYGADRRAERAMIRQYENDMNEVIRDFSAKNQVAALALAALPLQVRGYGHVKAASHRVAMARRDGLLAAFRAGGLPLAQAAE